MTYDPQTFWGRRAKRFGASYVGPMGDERATHTERVAFSSWLCEALPKDCGRLLDFGCGSGRFSELLAGRATEYVGCDIIATALELAKHAHPELQYRGMRDVLPVERDSIDTLVALVVFQHIPHDQWRTWCLEIKRVLKPGANVVVIDDGNGTAAHMFPRGGEVIASDLGLEVPLYRMIGKHHAFIGRFAG